MLLLTLQRSILPSLSLFLVAANIMAVQANARVGVTSQTSGEPLGKPPADSERVLRVGIDIQADELITTKDDDRAHLVFLDGSSLTVGPNAAIKVDRFVYDSTARTGIIALTIAKGAFRLVGGRISKNSPVTITTPSATIGIRGGIGLFSVTPQGTTAQFLFGIAMSVSAAGRTQTALRPGSQILTSLGEAPGAAVLIPTGGSAKILAALEGRPAASPNTVPDDKAVSSGFADGNSGKGTPVPSDRFRSASDISQWTDSTVLQSRGVATLQNAANSAAPPTPRAASAAPHFGPLPSPPLPPTPPPVANRCRDDDDRRFARDFHHDRSHFVHDRR